MPIILTFKGSKKVIEDAVRDYNNQPIGHYIPLVSIGDERPLISLGKEPMSNLRKNEGIYLADLPVESAAYLELTRNGKQAEVALQTAGAQSKLEIFLEERVKKLMQDTTLKVSMSRERLIPFNVDRKYSGATIGFPLTRARSGNVERSSKSFTTTGIAIGQEAIESLAEYLRLPAEQIQDAYQNARA